LLVVTFPTLKRGANQQCAHGAGDGLGPVGSEVCF
jgi:hypothetical protein